ncbi:type II secretion system F family protein [Deefgea salmonis]|uniref:Type II secretion system F family protein n=1 Tax=Deefgea salmonis TaxID=2875502 RepID=A0ABS8BLZ8_9NEIS|nr:type II secretion system F family protein [Deefgea salmonis]MCB5196551.1 type II secretion system F family protein [Deefgea salmonis]
MQFEYRAANEQGHIERGAMDAANLAEIEARLSRLGLTLIDAKTRAARRRPWRRDRISRRDLMLFTFHLEQLLGAGVPLLTGLIDLRDSLDQPRFREVLATLIEDIEGGRLLSQALAAHPLVFDAVFVQLIHAGEVSGQLVTVLNGLSASIQWQDELLEHSQKIMLYPIFVAGLILAVGVFLLLYLVPQLLGFLQAMQQKIPWHTQLLLALADFLQHFWWLLLLIAAAVYGGLVWLLRHDSLWADRFAAWQLQIPVLGPIQQKIILARFASCFALLYRAGIPILDCLRICQGVVGHRVMAEALKRITQSMSEGQGLAASFAQRRFFPPLVLRMLHIGETTGQLDQALNNVAYFYQRDIKLAVAQAQTLLEPMLTVILGLLLAWMMSAILLPIFDSLSQIR